MIVNEKGKMSDDYISINALEFEELKRLYNNCKGETFMFKGKEILKSYAKYMIEYLEEKLS